MSQENVEIVRRAYELFNGEAFNRGEEPDLRLFAPDVELDRSDAPLDAAVYRGHDGLRELLSLLQEMWERVRLEPQELTPIGEDRVVVSTRIVSVGREEIETVARGASVWTVRGGRITRVRTFQTKADALEAVGVGADDSG
jgi:ketosteroid isomerase-like protein